MVLWDWGESRLEVAALGKQRIGELRDQTEIPEWPAVGCSAKKARLVPL